MLIEGAWDESLLEGSWGVMTHCWKELLCFGDQVVTQGLNVEERSRLRDFLSLEGGSMLAYLAGLLVPPFVPAPLHICTRRALT